MKTIWDKECTSQSCGDHTDHTIGGGRCEMKQIKEALEAAYEVMNYMGDQLNNADQVEPEHEAIINPAFGKVYVALKGSRD